MWNEHQLLQFVASCLIEATVPKIGGKFGFGCKTLARGDQKLKEKTLEFGFVRFLGVFWSEHLSPTCWTLSSLEIPISQSVNIWQQSFTDVYLGLYIRRQRCALGRWVLRRVESSFKRKARYKCWSECLRQLGITSDKQRSASLQLVPLLLLRIGSVKDVGVCSITVGFDEEILRL